MYIDAQTLTVAAFIANMGMIAVVIAILALVWRWEAPRV